MSSTDLSALASSLSSAAESLISASISHTHSQLDSHLKASQDSLGAICRTNAEVLNSIPVFVDIMEENKKETVAAINGLKESLSLELNQLKLQFVKQSQNSRILCLQFAIQNSSIQSFSYYKLGHKEALNSSVLVQQACMNWIRNEGFSVIEKSLASYDEIEEIFVNGEKMFVKAIVLQIYGLTGIQGVLKGEYLVLPEL